jgi:hypothetical protein
MRAIRFIHLILNFINLPDYTGAGIAQSVERLVYVLDDRETGVRLSEVTRYFRYRVRTGFRGSSSLLSVGTRVSFPGE